MTGNEAYEEQFKKKSENLINNNPDKPYLKGFYNSFKAKYSLEILVSFNALFSSLALLINLFTL